METMDLEYLKRSVVAAIPTDESLEVEIKLVGNSGLQLRIDGPACLTNIGIWPNGLCDIDFVFVKSEQEKFEHYEFHSESEALNVLIPEIKKAAKRASG